MLYKQMVGVDSYLGLIILPVLYNLWHRCL